MCTLAYSGVEGLYSISACARLIHVGGVGLPIFAVDGTCLVARGAFPNDWLDVVPTALPFDSCVHRAIFTDPVMTCGASHASNGCPLS